MMNLSSGSRLRILLVVSALLLPCLQPSQSHAAGYGSLAGVVSDNKGVPLMGATVMVIGPMAFATEAASQTVERMVTDAHGRFTIAHLVPGWYSLKVSSPTRLPAMRNGVHVEAGETAVATFVLTDAFAPIRFQVPGNSVSSWGDDWKWVLRTSSTTRPILRFHQQPQVKRVGSKGRKPALPRGERVAGLLTGATPRDPLAQDFGMSSVFAYVKPVSPDSDVLVAGWFAPFNAETGTVATVLRRNQLKGDPQQIGLVFHQFSLLPGALDFPGGMPNASGQARGMVATYSETRLLAPRVTVTAGMDINYLNAIDNVFTAQPHVHLEYQATLQTMVSVQYGSARSDAPVSSLIERLGLLNAFPQISQRNGHLEMEQLNHVEVAVDHRVGRSVRLQAAAYHDSLHNAAVWGLGSSASSQAFYGNSLPSPAGNGMVINGGNLQSAGFRAVYAQTFGSHVEVLAAYSSGSALSARSFEVQNGRPYSPGVLLPEQTHALTGKITAQLPGTHTRLITSYEWVPTDRVTLVDPAGQANLQIQPYLGVQIRQPIPTPNFLPVHIDAVADFQNVLSQGYVPAGQGGQKPVVLSSGYHYIRGGFSVQF